MTSNPDVASRPGADDASAKEPNPARQRDGAIVGCFVEELFVSSSPPFFLKYAECISV